jgi:hypothetical protein
MTLRQGGPMTLRTGAAVINLLRAMGKVLLSFPFFFSSSSSRFSRSRQNSSSSSRHCRRPGDGRQLLLQPHYLGMAAPWRCHAAAVSNHDDPQVLSCLPPVLALEDADSAGALAAHALLAGRRRFDLRTASCTDRTWCAAEHSEARCRRVQRASGFAAAVLEPRAATGVSESVRSPGRLPCRASPHRP